MSTPNMRCSEPGGSVAVAIVALHRMAARHAVWQFEHHGGAAVAERGTLSHFTRHGNHLLRFCWGVRWHRHAMSDGPSQQQTSSAASRSYRPALFIAFF